MHILKLRSRSHGFTLIELLVVIAIIAILAAILFPVFAKAREKARQTSCASNMKQLGISLSQYVQDFDETFPAWARTVDGINVDWHYAVQPYIKNTNVFTCPSNTSTGIIEGGTGIVMHYSGNQNGIGNGAFDMALGQIGNGVFGALTSSGQNLAKIQTPSSVIAVFETKDPQDLCGHPIQPVIDDPPTTACAPMNFGKSLFAGHTTFSNYLFVDGHVKAMKPMQTVANGVNMWTIDNSQNGPNGASNYAGLVGNLQYEASQYQ